MPEITNNIK